MRLSPDQLIVWQSGFFVLNGTIVFTWALMLVLTLGSWLITRHLTTAHERSRWQNLVEIVVTGVLQQIEDIGLQEPRRYLSFLGTLFLFIAFSSIGTIFPGFEPPTGSLSTTAALAASVFVVVPVFGVTDRGVVGYLRTYIQPTPLMLPFNVISVLSRTLALAVRLFGNMMSGSMIVAVLVSVTPLLFPVVMTALGLLTGMVQAYIFSILAAVYIASVVGSHRSPPNVPTAADVHLAAA